MMKALLKLKSNKGQAAMEYAAIAVVILAVLAVAFRTPLSDALSTAFSKVSSSVTAIS